MNSLLQQALTAPPITVTLGGQEYELAYPMEAVILYKDETAKLDQARNQGRPGLTREMIRELKKQRTALLKEADTLRPAKREKWDDDKFARFEELMDEATVIKVAIDEDAGTGDSLYDLYNWRKISPQTDPERLRLALWVGLHKYVDREQWLHVREHVGGQVQKNEKAVNVSKVYTPQLSLEQLGTLITLGNGGHLTSAISKALTVDLIAPTEASEIFEVDEVDASEVEGAHSPNAPTPDAPAATQATQATHMIQSRPPLPPPEPQEERRQPHPHQPR